MTTRSLICSVLGHVDHGKSSLLDNIRHTSVAKGEAGGITQAIGASIIPIDTIKKICGDLLKSVKMEFKIPGLLFVDTPGHAAFSNLRKRGGSLADISILVIDINEGFKPQTLESIEILKAQKTPFIVAVNKIDKLYGWKTNKCSLLKSITLQPQSVQQLFEKKMYEIVGHFYEMSLQAERFDRVEDYTKQLALVPVSALTGEGVPELLMVLIGLSQKFLSTGLDFNPNSLAKGVVLEVKETQGLGTTLDVIIFDGKLKKNDTIVVGGLHEPVVTKIRALLEPAPLSEMMDKKSKNNQVNEAIAATGVKISAPDLDKAVAGMPLMACNINDIKQTKEEIQKEIEEVIVETEENGIILKANTLGGLEALKTLFKEKNIPIRKAMIGDISKKDVIEAVASKEVEPTYACVCGFNIEPDEDVKIYAKENGVGIITNPVIYNIIEQYEKWSEEKKKELEAKELENVTKPCKMMILKGYVFRQSNPAVCGVEILQGEAKNGIRFMKKEGVPLDTIKGMQMEKKNIEKAKKGDQVAMSFSKLTMGRQINEEDILYSYIEEREFKQLKELKKYLSNDEKNVLREIAEIMREKNPVWGI